MYHKQREKSEYLDKCIEFCKKDIEILQEFKKAYIKREGQTTLPSIPSFQQLAIIYEKQGKYAEAIEVSSKALSCGVKDKTKGGFNGRIEKLEKK